MITAFVSDIHANLTAFEAVLRDMQRFHIDEIVCLGDTVGYGPKPGECVDLAVRECKVAVLGNHDVLAAFPRLDLHGLREDVADGIVLARSVLTELQTAALREMPLTVRTGDACCVHASLADPAAFPYVQSRADACAHFGRQPTRVGFFGHTHVAEGWSSDGRKIRKARPEDGELALEEGQRYAINVGSVGQPRDGDPRACYVIYNSSAKVIRWHRVRYDIDETARAMESLGMSEFSRRRLYLGV